MNDMETRVRDIQQSQLRTFLELWEPSDRPVHCSNCINARVQGFLANGMPAAHCRAGYGQRRSVSFLIKPWPRSFLTASKCKDFEVAENDPNISGE